MKQQHDILEFVRKTPITKTSKQDPNEHLTPATSRSNETSASNTTQARDDEHPATVLRDCWSMEAGQGVQEKYDDLVLLQQETCLAKQSGPFSDVEDEIELQIKNGLDMGVGLHSHKTAVKIVDHIAKEILVAFCSDGASVMLGCKSGVSTNLENDFPDIIIWHCLNHCLQLVLDYSITDIKQVNHFKVFRDKIYMIFCQSNKN
ncbi:uncharacterized protein LOC143232444 [Tachypleus tridentatus]|uniref:uncharacterized protein LOC143232444 n=1 Tax=Tachypleus tridentatus TaxID=6853 RepID=UPI003FD25618